MYVNVYKSIFIFTDSNENYLLSQPASFITNKQSSPKIKTPTSTPQELDVEHLPLWKREGIEKNSDSNRYSTIREEILRKSILLDDLLFEKLLALESATRNLEMETESQSAKGQKSSSHDRHIVSENVSFVCLSEDHSENKEIDFTILDQQNETELHDDRKSNRIDISTMEEGDTKLSRYVQVDIISSIPVNDAAAGNCLRMDDGIYRSPSERCEQGQSAYPLTVGKTATRQMNVKQPSVNILDNNQLCSSANSGMVLPINSAAVTELSELKCDSIITTSDITTSTQNNIKGNNSAVKQIVKEDECLQDRRTKEVQTCDDKFDSIGSMRMTSIQFSDQELLRMEKTIISLSRSASKEHMIDELDKRPDSLIMGMDEFITSQLDQNDEKEEKHCIVKIMDYAALKNVHIVDERSISMTFHGFLNQTVTSQECQNESIIQYGQVQNNKSKFEAMLASDGKQRAETYNTQRVHGENTSKSHDKGKILMKEVSQTFKLQSISTLKNRSN